MIEQQPPNHTQPTCKLSGFVYRWYKRIGVCAAVFLVWIVFSGWLLNHSGSLNLAKHQFRSEFLSNWYGMKYTAPKKVFTSQAHWLVNSDETLILDGVTLPNRFSRVIGLTNSETLIAIANNREILLLNSHGNFIEKLDKNSLPFNYITKIGSGCDGIAITDIDNINMSHTLSTRDGIQWQPCSESRAWSVASNITPSQAKQIESQLIPTISLEKIILDLHTGRFFGGYGAYFVDAIGLCLFLLALNGLRLFFRSENKNNP